MQTDNEHIARTTHVWIDQCVPGMRLAETVTNKYMAVVANAGQVLDARLIEKIRRHQRSKVLVYTDSDASIESRTASVVLKEYRGNVEKMQSVMYDLYSNKPLDAEAVTDLSESVFSRHDDITGVLECLNQVRSADEYTYAHCLNVSYISVLVAKWLSANDDEIRGVIEAGLLHDVGKSRIPLEILNKPGRLTDEEFSVMKTHPTLGFRILSESNNIRKSSALASLTHHEKMNGAGYPMGISSSRIPQFGKICAVADIFDAMTSNRVYRKKLSPFEVFKLMETETFGSLDQSMVILFLRNLANYYVGDKVRISDGSIGQVAYINPLAVSRPIVQTSSGIVDLSEEDNKDLVIEELV